MAIEFAVYYLAQLNKFKTLICASIKHRVTMRKTNWSVWNCEQTAELFNVTAEGGFEIYGSVDPLQGLLRWGNFGMRPAVAKV